MRAGQSNAVKGEVASKDTLPTDGVKGSGVTADSLASAVQARALTRCAGFECRSAESSHMYAN